MRSTPLGEVATFAVLVAMVLVPFRAAIMERQVVFEPDTLNFYYPLESWSSQQLKHGDFPLWNPNIFAGYPIFADGELGLANPLHLLLLKLLPVEQAYVWQRVTAALIGAASMFFFCRTLRLGPLAALLGALTFVLGSFLAEQQHHDDMVRTVVWTPLMLACAELALQRGGWRKGLWLTGAALALAMVAVGLHPQGLAMAALVLGSFMLFRGVAGVSPAPAPLQQAARREGTTARRRPSPIGRTATLAKVDLLARRLASTLGWGLYVALVGLGLAAVQLLPTAEVGLATFRESQPDYSFATSYSLHFHNLISLVFPYFFRAVDSRPWSLWAPWETTVYVGLIPLTLGWLGLIRGPRPLALYFGALALVGLWLALADSAPFDLYAWLWRLPGFSALRVPARYAFFFVLGWSVLAAYGLAALQRRRPVGWPGSAPIAAVGVLALLVVGGLAMGMDNVRSTLLGEESAVLDWIRSAYLSLPHGEGLTADVVYVSLLHSLDLGTPRTTFSLVMLGISVVLVALAALGRPRGLWPFGLVVAAAVDLISFGTGLHYSISLDKVAAPGPAAQFLASQAGPWRVFSPIPPLAASVQADRLAPLQVEDFGGYSSLESRRNFSYGAQLTGSQNQLLDLANIRYVVYPARLPALPDFERVPIDPTRPLMNGGAGTLGGIESYSFDRKPTTSVWVIAALAQAFEVPQDATVAEVTVVPRDGEPVRFPLRAGVDLAEWAYDSSDAVGKIQHAKPDSIAYDRPAVELMTGNPLYLHLYYSEHPLPRAMEVQRVEIRYVYPEGAIELYGLGLYDGETRVMNGTAQTMRTKFRSVYRDNEVEIFENAEAFPRGYVVPGAIIGRSDQAGVGVLLYTPFDPMREVLLQEPEGSAWVRASTDAGGLVEARRLEAQADRVVYQASAPVGGFFVHEVTFAEGWRAWVDGQETPVLHGNYLFQAVPVRPGDHIVELRYEPTALRLGLIVSFCAAVVALAVLVIGLLRLRR